ncbi:winged helix-turn-helix transcriptional regulator [Candidatus Woesearchaeota archaeon]|nr:winged helix-turn-helix transcriptional regulator [Candidatus Woesearchaeota archaeon]
MQEESLYSATKWDIILELSKKRSSPLELSKSTSTSIANVSQQLRFLELAGIVKSQRISNRDKGQPRLLYSLAGNQSFLIATMPGFAAKKRCELSTRQRIIMSSWFLQDPRIHKPLEKFAIAIEDQLSDILFIGIKEGYENELIIFSSSATAAEKIRSTSSKVSDLKSQKIKVIAKKDNPTNADFEKYHVLHIENKIHQTLGEEVKK